VYELEKAGHELARAELIDLARNKDGIRFDAQTDLSACCLHR
jgi:hypothetical protein